jgi:hypothetical protein
MATSFEAMEHKKAYQKVYAKEQWEKIKAEKAAAAAGERPDFKQTPNGIKSIAPPTLKVSELKRMDQIVIKAYMNALQKGKHDDAEMIKTNPLNAHIDFDQAISEEG